MSIKIGEMSKMMSITPQTMRKYIKNGTAHAHTTPAGNYYFTDDDVYYNMNGQDKPTMRKTTWVYYLRSSSGDNKLIESQKRELQNNYPTPDYIIKDKASGLNENRRGLNQLIKLAQEGKITDIAITYQDRLTRFGYSYLKELFSQNNVNIHELHERVPMSNQHDELMRDFMNLVSSFAGRFYRLKNTENKKKLLNTALSELPNNKD